MLTCVDSLETFSMFQLISVLNLWEIYRGYIRFYFILNDQAKGREEILRKPIVTRGKTLLEGVMKTQIIGGNGKKTWRPQRSYLFS